MADQPTTEATAKPGPDTKPPPEKIKRPVNWVMVGIGVGILMAMAAGVFFTLRFIDAERERDLRAWQIRLGIVTDGRAAAINDWIDLNFGHIRELVENASLQLYATELSGSRQQTGPDAPGGGAGDTGEEPAAEATFVRNLLSATADRTGFAAPAPTAQIDANVERVGVAGLALVDAKGQTVVSTAGMPPLTGRIRKAIAKALGGDPALIDIYLGATNLPTMGFALPIYGIQDDGPGAQGIGAVIGIKVIGKELFQRLKQPGETDQTAETYLVRKQGATVEYLTPLRDGTGPLKRSLAIDTPGLAAAFALEVPGGFGVKRDYLGEEVLVTSRPLSQVPWVLVRKITTAEALSGTETRLATMLIVFVLIIVGVTIAIFAVWKHGSSVRAAEAAERHRVAAERFENLSKFMKLVTNSQPTVIAAVDGDTHYTFANEPAARDAGIPVEDMMGKTMASVIGPVKAQALAEINDEVLDKFERRTGMLTFGEGDDIQVIKSDHIPLRSDRDYPPGVLMILNDITELTQERRRSEAMLRQLINTLVSVVDRRDPYSAHHSARVAEVARAIAGEMGMDEQSIKALDIAGHLMSLGKIFISPETLMKTDNLTDGERHMIQHSYLVSAELLRGVSFDGPVVAAIRQMGENWDGSGPLELKGGVIAQTARLLAVANAFVGMVSARAYRDAMTFEKVSDILLADSGSKFDRKPVSALMNYLENRGGTETWAHYRDKPKVSQKPPAAEPAKPAAVTRTQRVVVTRKKPDTPPAAGGA